MGSQQPDDQSEPTRLIDTTGVDAEIRSPDVQWTGSNAGRVRADHWSGDVSVSLTLMDVSDSHTGVSTYFTPSSARDIVESEFRTLQLPSGDGDAVVGRIPPHVVLGVDRDATHSEIREAFRARVKDAHPDSGGSEEEYKRVMEAREALLK